MACLSKSILLNQQVINCFINYNPEVDNKLYAQQLSSLNFEDFKNLLGKSITINTTWNLFLFMIWINLFLKSNFLTFYFAGKKIFIYNEVKNSSIISKVEFWKVKQSFDVMSNFLCKFMFVHQHISQDGRKFL